MPRGENEDVGKLEEARQLGLVAEAGKTNSLEA